jgi:hypothetical protein
MLLTLKMTPDEMRVIILCSEFVTLALLLSAMGLLFKAARAAKRSERHCREMLEYLKYIYGDAARSSWHAHKNDLERRGGL